MHLQNIAVGKHRSSRPTCREASTFCHWGLLWGIYSEDFKSVDFKSVWSTHRQEYQSSCVRCQGQGRWTNSNIHMDVAFQGPPVPDKYVAQSDIYFKSVIYTI